MCSFIRGIFANLLLNVCSFSSDIFANFSPFLGVETRSLPIRFSKIREKPVGIVLKAGFFEAGSPEAVNRSRLSEVAEDDYFSDLFVFHQFGSFLQDSFFDTVDDIVCFKRVLIDVDESDFVVDDFALDKCSVCVQNSRDFGNWFHCNLKNLNMCDHIQNFK